MGKGKGNPIRSKPLQPSFFMQQRQKNGDYWLNHVSTEFIRRNAMRIFKDFATGSANPDYEFTYFLNYDFTYNLAVAASDNAQYNYTCWLGLYNSPVLNNDMARVADEQYEKYKTYNIIVTYMNSILQDVTFNGGTLVRYYLQEMVATIRHRKNDFNGGFITIPKEYDKKFINVERRNFNNDNRFSKENPREPGFLKKSNETNL